MSNEEAKFILHAYRPNGADANDPAFGAALEQAKNDPALGAWFAREQAHAAAVAQRLREIAPPPGLREAILAGGRATERAKPSRAFLRGPWLALAACVALLLAVGVAVWPKSASSSHALVAFALDDVVNGRHGGHGGPEKALQATLASDNVHLAHGLPVDFRTLAGTGCRTLSVAGHDVLEVCFVRNGAEFHCYIGRADEFTSDTSNGPTFIERGALAAASWADARFRYVVVGAGSLDAVKRLL